MIIFSHGKESGPWGTKIRALAEIAKRFGHKVDSIDYSDMQNPDERVQTLSRVLDSINQPVILVGSSMGGYVSLVASMEYDCKGVFLLAPALYMPDYEKQSYTSLTSNICVVHGMGDDIIPYQNSQRYCQESGSELHLIDGDHRLNSSLKQVCEIFESFLVRVSG